MLPATSLPSTSGKRASGSAELWAVGELRGSKGKTHRQVQRMRMGGREGGYSWGTWWWVEEGKGLRSSKLGTGPDLFHVIVSARTPEGWERMTVPKWPSELPHQRGNSDPNLTAIVVVAIPVMREKKLTVSCKAWCPVFIRPTCIPLTPSKRSFKTGRRGKGTWFVNVKFGKQLKPWN